MVVRKDELPKFPVLDANDDLTRLGRKVNVELDEEYLRQLQEDDEIDPQYKTVLYHLLNIEERLDPCKKNNETDGVTKEKKRSRAIVDDDDDDDDDDGNDDDDDDEEEEDDPQYEDFLKHLNEDGANDRKKLSGKDLEREMERFMSKKNVEENTLENEGKCTSDSDVEILDEAACLTRGNSNPFVSSKKFSEIMWNGVCHVGESSACAEFRKGVINVLKKPYDKKEYAGHVEAIRAGNYFDYHPDLQQKLKKYRYNRRKRLTIFRGFFFWLQNLTQEGAFKPWKDRACLAVDAPQDA